MRYLVILLAFLPGCANYEAFQQRMAEQQERHQEQQRQRQEEQQQAYIDGLGNQCLALGYVRGTPEIKNCMLQLHQSNLSQQESRRAAALNYLLSQQPRQAVTTNCQNTFMGVQCTSR